MFQTSSPKLSEAFRSPVPGMVSLPWMPWRRAVLWLQLGGADGPGRSVVNWCPVGVPFPTPSMSQPFFWRVFEPRAGTFEEVQQADVEKNAHNFIIGQIFSPWRLHLWDTHKATVAVTLPPQPSGGHTVLSGDISPAIVWAQHTSLFNSTFFLDHIPIYIGSRTHQMIRDLFMYRFSSPTHKAQFEQFQGTSGGNHGFLMVFTCFDPQV